MKKNILLGVILASTMTNSFATTINDVNFTRNLKAPEYPIAYNFYQGFLAHHPNDTLSTASFDLNNDGIGEFATKIEGNNVCNTNGCVTSIFMNFPTGWKEILHTHSKTMQLIGDSQPGKILNILINGKYVWSFNGDKYIPLLQNFGTVQKLEWNEANIDLIQEASRSLNVDIASGQWVSSPITTNIRGGKTFIVTVNSDLLKDHQGTKYAIIAPSNSVWKTVLTFKGTSNISSSPSGHENTPNDLYIQTFDGVNGYEWDFDNKDYKKKASLN